MEAFARRSPRANVEDGVEGMRFIAATLASSTRNAQWVDLPST